VGISRDYPLKTQTSKQPIGKVPGYEIIPSHPLKYPRSKQGLRVWLCHCSWRAPCETLGARIRMLWAPRSGLNPAACDYFWPTLLRSPSPMEAATSYSLPVRHNC
jgi:hypothetical protein